MAWCPHERGDKLTGDRDIIDPMGRLFGKKGEPRYLVRLRGVETVHGKRTRAYATPTIKQCVRLVFSLPETATTDRARAA
eukprot:1424996-Pyramimonas_sp.AAC.1